MPIRLIIVDEHLVVRRGLESMFDGTDIEIVGEASSIDQAESLIQLIPANVILIDPRVSGCRTAEGLGRILERYREARLLVYSPYLSSTMISQAVALGCCGAISKGVTRDVLVAAIQQVSVGQKTWTREELRKVSSSPSGDPELDIDTQLTHRESEVLVQLTFGKTNKEIAQTLEISYETVKEHVQHILRKIGVTDRTQAAVWAVRNGLA